MFHVEQRSDSMKTLFEYIAGIITMVLCGVGIAAIGGLIVVLSPLIMLFLIAKD